MQNVEVYEVGKEQLWRWLDLNGAENDGVGCYVETACVNMYEGCYVVVMNWASFGFVPIRPAVMYSSETLHAALSFIARRLDGDEYDMLNRGIAYEYEVWHIEDDDNLWSAWEYRVLHASDINDVDFDELADDAWPFCDYTERYAVCTPQNDDDVLDSLEQLRAAGELDGESHGDGYYHCDVTFDAKELTEELIYSLSVVLMDLAREKGIELSSERWALRYTAYLNYEQIIFTEPTAALSVAASLARWAPAVSHTYIVMFDNQNKDEKYSVKVVNDYE